MHNMIFQRFIAILLLITPGAFATYGLLMMKNAIFFALDPAVPFSWWRFLIGALFLFGGLAFIGGWIFSRDRKRNYLAPRFRKKKKKPKAQS